jgi:hypothetical protein
MTAARQQVRRCVERGYTRTIMIRMFFRCAAWLLVVAVAAFTLSPIEFRPETGAPADWERFAAFALIGGAFCLGYPKGRFGIVLLAIGFAGLLESLQTLVSGRHAHLHDYVVKAFGVAVGALVAGSIDRRR